MTKPDQPQEPNRHERRKLKAAERKVLTVPEAGEQLGLSRNSAYEAARRGDIPTIRIGKLLLVPKAAFDRLLSGDGKAA